VFCLDSKHISCIQHAFVTSFIHVPDNIGRKNLLVPKGTNKSPALLSSVGYSKRPDHRQAARSPVYVRKTSKPSCILSHAAVNRKTRRHSFSFYESCKTRFLCLLWCNNGIFDSRVKSRFPYWESDFKMRKTAFTNTYDAGVFFNYL